MEIAGENEKREGREKTQACMSLLQPLVAPGDEAIVGRRQSAALPIDGVGLTPDVPRLKHTPLTHSIAAIQHQRIGPRDGMSSQYGVLGYC